MPKRILIIDDEKDMRVYLRTLFKTAGYQTDVAENGDEGIRKARAAPPDLITLDVLMPRKSGMRAYRELRTAPETRQVPIIILTGLTRQADFFGEDLGDLPRPDLVVEKPIDRDSFVDKVRRVLDE